MDIESKRIIGGIAFFVATECIPLCFLDCHLDFQENASMHTILFISSIMLGSIIEEENKAKKDFFSWTALYGIWTLILLLCFFFILAFDRQSIHHGRWIRETTHYILLHFGYTILAYVVDSTREKIRWNRRNRLYNDFCNNISVGDILVTGKFCHCSYSEDEWFYVVESVSKHSVSLRNLYWKTNRENIKNRVSNELYARYKQIYDKTAELSMIEIQKLLEQELLLKRVGNWNYNVNCNLDDCSKYPFTSYIYVSHNCPQ